MTERYWDPDTVPEVDDQLKDWVSENVIDALGRFEDEMKAHVFETDDDNGNVKLVVHVSSFDGPEGKDDWGKSFDLLDMVRFFARVEYTGRWPLPESPRKIVEERARLFDELAKEFRKAAGMPASS